MTADVISAERRERTLGLLFLSRVNGMEIVIAKLASVGLPAACALVAFLPILALPVLAGGVSPAEVFRSALVLLDTLFLALAVGLRVSALGRDSLRTALWSLLSITLLLLFPALLEWLVRGLGLSTSGIGLCSPLVAICDAGDAGYRAGVERFWISLFLVQALGWLLLADAGVKVRRSLSDESDEVRPQRDLRPVSRQARLEAIAKSNPIEWLVRRQLGLGRAIWLVALARIGYSMLRWIFYRALGYPTPGFYGMIVFGLDFVVSFVLQGLLAWIASRFLFEASRSRQLELLLTIPQGPRAILIGQWRALIGLLWRPITISMGTGLLLEVSTLASGPDSLVGSGFWSFKIPTTCLLEVADTALVVAAACWIGMWFGLQGLSTLSTMLRAAGLTCGIPFLLKMFVAIGLAIPVGRLFQHNFSVWLVMAWGYELVALAYFVWLIRRTRRRLIRGLATAPS
jgi:hypothetical protein